MVHFRHVSGDCDIFKLFFLKFLLQFVAYHADFALNALQNATVRLSEDCDIISTKYFIP